MRAAPFILCGALGVSFQLKLAKAQVTPQPVASDIDPVEDIVDADQTDDVWLDPWVWSWDPGFSAPWLPSTPPWSLALAGGRRTSRSHFLQEDARQRRNGHAEYYAFATLRMPLSFGRLSSARGPSTHSELPVLKGSVPIQSAAVHAPARLAYQLRSGYFVPARLGSERNPKASADTSETPPSPKPSIQSPAAGTPARNSDEPKVRSSAASHVAFSSGQTAETSRERMLLHFIRFVRVSASGDAPGDNQRQRYDSLIRRSRSSGLMPELRLRGVAGFDRTTSAEEAVGIYPGETTTRGGRDSLLEARLTFRLDRLIFGDQEGSLERQRAAFIAERARRAESAVEAALDWLWATERSLDSSLFDDERTKWIQKASAALVRLHELTFGWFVGSQTLRSLGVEQLLSRDSPEANQGSGSISPPHNPSAGLSGDEADPDGSRPSGEPLER